MLAVMLAILVTLFILILEIIVLAAIAYVIVGVCCYLSDRR